MSSRSLRKLQGRDNELKALAALIENEPSASSEEDENDSSTSKRKNVFALFDPSSTKDGAVESSHTDEDEKEADIVEQGNNVPESKTKRKKRKNKKKKIAEENHHTVQTNEEDFDKVVRELESMPTNGPAPGNHGKSNKKIKYVLAVEHRFLNPDNELKRIFGARTLMGDANYRHRQSRASRGSWLTGPSPNWPKMVKTGLSMNLIERSQRYQYFAFEHNREYQETQFRFLDAVESSDHNLIAAILRDHNYHVDSLLTLSNVCRINDDSQTARQLLERALYCSERHFHSLFNLTTGTCRLSYKRIENRSFFLTLYHHLHFVSQRGCSRTALELCKVLLNLDPDDDPLCVLLFIDYFALQAAEYDFLIQLFNEWEPHKNLSQLPNFSYSLALAHFEKAQTEGQDWTTADRLLQLALLKFPSVLMSLLEKCSIEPDKKVSLSPFFTTEAIQTSPNGLQLVCNLFVGRNFTLWKSPEVLAWLEKNVNAVLERVDAKDPEIVKGRQKRKKYQKPPLNIYRYAMISDLPGVISFLPPEIRLGEVLSHDPLPPKDGIVTYTRPERNRSRHGGNPLGLFLHSLLPQFNPDDEPQIDLNGAVGGVNQDQTGLRERAVALMEAMREMMNSIQPDAENGEVPEFLEDEWD